MGATIFWTIAGMGVSQTERGKQEEKVREQRERGTRSDVQGYWETYQKWGQEAATDYERNITSTKARMAASGIKTGTEQWETNLANITSEYEKELEGFKTGVTGSAVSDWAKTQQAAVMGTDIEGEEIITKEATDLSMEDYLTQEFGTLDLDVGAPTAAEVATTTSRQSAAGTPRRDATGITGTPWW
jgi:hypothetical protein